MKKIKIPDTPDNWVDDYKKYIESRHLEDYQEECSPGFEILQNTWLDNWHIIVAYAFLKEPEYYCKKKIIGYCYFSFDNSLLDYAKSRFLHVYDYKCEAGNIYQRIVSADLNAIGNKDERDTNRVDIMPYLVKRGCCTWKKDTPHNFFGKVNDVYLHRLVAGCQYYIKGKVIHHLRDDHRGTIFYNLAGNLLPLDRSFHSLVTKEKYDLTYEEIKDIKAELRREVEKKEPFPQGKLMNKYSYWHYCYLKYIRNLSDEEIQIDLGSKFKDNRRFNELKKHCDKYFPCLESYYNGVISKT